MRNQSLIPQLWDRPSFPSLRRAVDRLFDTWSEDIDIEPFWGTRIPQGMFAPRIDVAETDKEFRVTAELPGMDEKDVELKLTKDALILKGEKKEEKEEKGRDYYRRERHFGAFCQEVPLPSGVTEDKINAVFKNGVLTVTLPKTAEAQQETKKIEIKKAA